jgi:redox-sensing transcriptional repressor
MCPNSLRGIPLPSIKRLPLYLRFLKTLRNADREVVSTTHIADALHIDPTLVRKDLAVTGIVGRPRIGYRVCELIEKIEEFLGWNNASDAFLVGAGHLGTALLGFEGFAEIGLRLVAAFDVDPAKIGSRIHDREVLHVDRLPDLARRMHVHIGVVTTSVRAAQDAADVLVRGGIRAIWNFTPAPVTVPDDVVVENVDLASSLAALTSRLKGLPVLGGDQSSVE